jgi:hypothetical protein
MEQPEFQLKHAADQNPAMDILYAEGTILLESLVDSENAETLFEQVDAQVADFVKLNIMHFAMTGLQVEEIPPNRGLTTWSDPEALFVQATEHDEIFRKNDTLMLWEATRTLIMVDALVSRTPKPNRGFLTAAFLDGFWSLQKLTMCLFAVILIADGSLKPTEDKIVHWLCLAMREYRNQWNRALMTHIPEHHAHLWQRASSEDA